MCGGWPLLQLLSLLPRVLTITALAQLFLLGCTWVFGLFLLDLRSQVQSYTFTILNCLQGFFLFLLHCLLNKKVGFGPSRGWAGTPSPLSLSQGCPSPDLASWALQVREEYRKWACMVVGNKYSEFATSTSGSSQNQTRVRADPGVGVSDQKAAWAGLSAHGAPLSPGPQAIRVGHVTLQLWPGQQCLWPQQLSHMRKTVPFSPTTLLPLPSCPRMCLGEKELTVVAAHQTLEHTARVESQT